MTINKKINMYVVIWQKIGSICWILLEYITLVTIW
jgi:hypothetical protein